MSVSRQQDVRPTHLGTTGIQQQLWDGNDGHEQEHEGKPAQHLEVQRDAVTKSRQVALPCGAERCSTRSEYERATRSKGLSARQWNTWALSFHTHTKTHNETRPQHSLALKHGTTCRWRRGRSNQAKPTSSPATLVGPSRLDASSSWTPTVARLACLTALCQALHCRQRPSLYPVAAVQLVDMPVVDRVRCDGPRC